MKRIMNVLCIIAVMVCCVCVKSEVYAQSILPRALMNYQMEESTSSGNVVVRAVVTVNDGTSSIVGYSVVAIETKIGVTNAKVTASGIMTGGKQVYVIVNYYYYGTSRTETIYFDI